MENEWIRRFIYTHLQISSYNLNHLGNLTLNLRLTYPILAFIDKNDKVVDHIIHLTFKQVKGNGN